MRVSRPQSPGSRRRAVAAADSEDGGQVPRPVGRACPRPLPAAARRQPASTVVRSPAGLPSLARRARSHARRHRGRPESARRVFGPMHVSVRRCAVARADDASACSTMGTRSVGQPPAAALASRTSTRLHRDRTSNVDRHAASRSPASAMLMSTRSPRTAPSQPRESTTLDRYGAARRRGD